jgi:predicted CXXCH cytochrome family protein
VEQGCVACHQPHGGKLGAFLKAEGESLCFRCHDSRLKNISRFVHYPYKEGNCSTCHLPHAGAGNANLAMETDDLCTMCHPSRHKEFPHPVGVKPSPDIIVKPENKLGFEPDDVVVCTTCHAPHAADIVFLLRANIIGGELCYECHQR